MIDDLREGKSQRLVSNIYGVPKSTVGDIWKDREKIQNYVLSSDCPSVSKKRHIIREAKFEDLEKALVTWFMQQCSKGAPVSGPLLKEKALQLSIPFIQKVQAVPSHLWLAIDGFPTLFLGME